MTELKTAPTLTIAVGESKIVQFDFTDDLDGQATLSGTPIIIEVGSSDLTLTNKTASGVLAQVLVTGQLANMRYELSCTVTDSSTPQQTFIGIGRLLCLNP